MLVCFGVIFCKLLLLPLPLLHPHTYEQHTDNAKMLWCGQGKLIEWKIYNFRSSIRQSIMWMFEKEKNVNKFLCMYSIIKGDHFVSGFVAYVCMFVSLTHWYIYIFILNYSRNGTRTCTDGSNLITNIHKHTHSFAHAHVRIESTKWDEIRTWRR